MQQDLNPIQVKRRERRGLTLVGLGILGCVAGIIAALSFGLLGLAGVAVSLVLLSWGVTQLRNIPDLIATPDESY